MFGLKVNLALNRRLQQPRSASLRSPMSFKTSGDS
jgi:hypothetical protein